MAALIGVLDFTVGTWELMIRSKVENFNDGTRDAIIVLTLPGRNIHLTSPVACRGCSQDRGLGPF
jgi:hypothetical protein